MAEKELKSAIREKFEAEKERIFSQARKEAAEIIAQADKKIQSIRESHAIELERRKEEEKQKLLSQISLSVKKEITVEKEKFFKKIVEAVFAGLDNVRKNEEEYHEILKSLITECKENFSHHPKLKIWADENDAQFCQKIVRELDLDAEIKKISLPAGGIIISDLEERHICDNTFESRLKKITPQLREELYKIWL